jgi:hypothetical protein
MTCLLLTLAILEKVTMIKVSIGEMLELLDARKMTQLHAKMSSSRAGTLG